MNSWLWYPNIKQSPAFNKISMVRRYACPGIPGASNTNIRIGDPPSGTSCINERGEYVPIQFGKFSELPGFGQTRNFGGSGTMNIFLTKTLRS